MEGLVLNCVEIPVEIQDMDIFQDMKIYRNFPGYRKFPGFGSKHHPHYIVKPSE